MAIFGNLETLKKQVTDKKFQCAFDYLAKVLDESSKESKRLYTYELDIFKKIDLDDKNFALEQTYLSKEKEKCFYESHRKYIDVQFILEGEEIIEVDNIKNLIINFPYDEKIDLIKYENSNFSSSVKLKKGDVAIFFPEDAHMPGIKVMKSERIIKTVIKVKV